MPKQTSVAPKAKGFSVDDLTEEQIDLAVEKKLGVHPRFLVWTYSEVTVNLWELEHAGGRFDGFLPYRKEVGIV